MPVTVSNIWGGTATVSGNTVIIEPASYTSNINNGDSKEVGMNLSFSGSLNTPSISVQ